MLCEKGYLPFPVSGIYNFSKYSLNGKLEKGAQEKKIGGWGRLKLGKSGEKGEASKKLQITPNIQNFD